MMVNNRTIKGNIYEDLRPWHIKGDACFIICVHRKLGAYLSYACNGFVEGYTTSTWKEIDVPVFQDGEVATVPLG